METLYGIFSESFWWAAPILVTLTVALAGVINRALKTEGFWSQLVAWLVGTGLSVGAWANKEERDVEIFLGIHAGDHAIYPDCTPESREACEHAFKVSNWNSEKVSYQAPFVNIDKAGVLKEGVKAMESLGFKEEEVMFILSNTHTCYNPSSDGLSCGKCGSCNERVLAFYENGLIDPVPYQEPWEVVLRRAKGE